MRGPAEVRFMRFIRKLDNGCWAWTGFINCWGYGQFGAGHRRPVGAHRFAYEMWVGPIPPGMQIDHLCHTWVKDSCKLGDRCPHRSCVNPAHLEAVTPRENSIRGNPGIPRSAYKTHCVSGHLYDEANTMLTHRGHRVCRICQRERRARYMSKPGMREQKNQRRRDLYRLSREELAS